MNRPASRTLAALAVAVTLAQSRPAAAKPGEEQLAEIEAKIREGDGYRVQYFAARRAVDAAAAEDAAAKLIKARNDAIGLILAAYVDKQGAPLLAPTPSSWKVEKPGQKGKFDLVNFAPTFLWTSPGSADELKREEIAHTAPSGTVYLGERAFENPVHNIAGLILREGVRFARLPDRSKRLKKIAKETGWSLEAAAAEEQDDETIESLQAMVDKAGAIGLYPMDVAFAKLRQSQKQQSKALRRIGNGDDSAQVALKQQKDEELALAREVLKLGREDLETELSLKERARVEDLMRQARQIAGEPEPSREAKPKAEVVRQVELGKWTAGVRLGVAFGVKSLDHLGALSLDGGYRLFRGGYVTASIQAQFEGEVDLLDPATGKTLVDAGGKVQRTAFGLLMIPVGFEYDYALPLRGLFLVARVGVGYAAALNRFGAAHFGFVTPELGVKYAVDRRFFIGGDVISLPLLFNKDLFLASFRLLVAAGVSF